jgi:hypothetical protein
MKPFGMVTPRQGDDESAAQRWPIAQSDQGPVAREHDAGDLIAVKGPVIEAVAIVARDRIVPRDIDRRLEHVGVDIGRDKPAAKEANQESDN